MILLKVPIILLYVYHIYSHKLTSSGRLEYKIYSDGESRSIEGQTAVNCTNVVFPSYPGLDFVACIGGYGEGNAGLLVSGNKWIYNTSSVQKTYSAVVWHLLYKPQ